MSVECVHVYMLCVWSNCDKLQSSLSSSLLPLQDFKEWDQAYHAYTYQTREILELLELFVNMTFKGRIKQAPARPPTLVNEVNHYIYSWCFCSDSYIPVPVYNFDNSAAFQSNLAIPPSSPSLPPHPTYP